MLKKVRSASTEWLRIFRAGPTQPFSKSLSVHLIELSLHSSPCFLLSPFIKTVKTTRLEITRLAFWAQSTHFLYLVNWNTKLSLEKYNVLLMTVQIVTINFIPLHQREVGFLYLVFTPINPFFFNIIMSQFILINHISQISITKGTSFDTWVEIISFFLAV